MKYKVGDKVRVRQWDDMAKEYGFINSVKRDIDIPGCTFVNSMKKFCGSVVTISNIVSDNSIYLIKEDGYLWYWTNDMFEPYKVKIVYQTDFIDKETSSRMVEMAEQLEKQPIIFTTKSNIEGCKLSTELMGKIAEETKEMVKKNIETEIEKKKVHLKDEDHLKRVEKIKKKIEYYKWKSGFNLIDEVVPGRVVKVTYYYKKYEMVCDPRDEFSMEKVLYLAIAKEMYGHTLTPEGIEKKAEELKYEKVYVKKVEQAMKMLAAMEELEKENAEYEALLEARRQKRWERKQRQMDRRAEKKKAQEEKEREEKIQIQTEAYLRAMKAVKEEEKKEENVPVEEENNKVESKPEENMTETTKESTKESTESTKETDTTTE